METQLSSEVGPAGRLFSGCIDIYWALIHRILTLKYKTSQKQALRTEFGRFYFWGDGFYPYEGRLDEILANSSRLRNRVLSILVEIGEILCDGKAGLFALVNQNLNDERLRIQRQDIRALVEGIRETLDDAVSSSSESDSGSDVSNEGSLLQKIIYNLRARIQCLVDLTGSLERPAADADLEDVPSAQLAAFEVSGPAEIWTRKVVDTFPQIDTVLAQRLGEANWQRYQRVSQRLEQAESFGNEDENDGDDQSDSEGSERDDLGDLPTFTATTGSSADPSSIFSSIGKSTGTTVTSVSDANFDYAFPRARPRRFTKDLRSQATFTSVVSNDEGQRGWLKIPSMPKGAEEGKTFQCTVCGDRQKDIIYWTEWKKHVFSDLQPYICLYPDCKGGLTSYTTRKAWADHEFSIHRKNKSWTCNDCAAKFLIKSDMREHAYSNHGNVLMRNQLEALVNAAETSTDVTENNKCPFCFETPGVKSRAFVMHVGKHMEEIALAVLPRDSEFEDDRGSISSNHSATFDERAEDAAMATKNSAAFDKLADDDSNIAGTEPESKPDLQKPEFPGFENFGPLPKSDFTSIDQFAFRAVIGKGAYAKIILARSKSFQELYAIKIYRKDRVIEQEQSQCIETEKNIYIKAHNHPFITKLITTFQSETRLYYVLEFVPGGDLMHHIQAEKFDPSRSRFYAAEACLVLDFLHRHNIIYRHLKLDNILLAPDGHIKVVDFGESKELHNRQATTLTFIGTPEFMAPEIILDKPYSFAVDWWSFGVLLYQMLLRQAPFRGEDEDAIYHAILDDEPTDLHHLPPSARYLIQNLLNKDPKERLGHEKGAEEIMRHDYFELIDWKKVARKEVTPSFLPLITGPEDLSNFDAEFTKETPILTPILSALTPVMQEQFKDFSLYKE